MSQLGLFTPRIDGRIEYHPPSRKELISLHTRIQDEERQMISLVTALFEKAIPKEHVLVVWAGYTAYRGGALYIKSGHEDAHRVRIDFSGQPSVTVMGWGCNKVFGSPDGSMPESLYHAIRVTTGVMMFLIEPHLVQELLDVFQDVYQRMVPLLMQMTRYEHSTKEKL